MAVKEIAPKCDMFFVIGSRNSSNSVRLVEVAKKAGCEKSMLMHSEEKLPIEELINSETIWDFIRSFCSRYSCTKLNK